jgi:hypothetical protein
MLRSFAREMAAVEDGAHLPQRVPVIDPDCMRFKLAFDATSAFSAGSIRSFTSQFIGLLVRQVGP